MPEQTKTSDVTITKAEFDAALRRFLKEANLSVPTEADVTLLVDNDEYQDADANTVVAKVTWQL